MQDHKKDLKYIREMMERSSIFISLSGLSGIFAGTIALIASIIVYFYFVKADLNYFGGQRNIYSIDLIKKMFVLASLTLVISIIGGVFFTFKKSKDKSIPVWTKNTINILFHMGVPLITGGFLCLILLKYGIVYLIAPFMLVFYGLALVSASKFTFGEIKFLGILEITLGLLGCLFVDYGLVLWAIGFGILHIIYGVVMLNKYK